ncbi:MAG: pilus assembly protein PilM [Elusimicrobiales bacterium]|nr:pilus assembly protein PilM [Elusimicrobiales bacterium]
MATKKNNKKGVLGIYISPKEIAIAEVQLKGAGKLQPDHLVKFPTDFPKKDGAQRPMSQNADFFKPGAAWVNKFKTAIKKVNWNASDAVVTLSESFGILRYFSMPAIPRKFWSKSIPLESKKYIPLSFDNVMMDYDAIPSEQGKKLSVLFGISQKDTIDFLVSLLKEMGFRLASLEISSVSLERLFSYIDPKDHVSHGYVHAAEDATHLLFSANGRPVLHREFENEGGNERRRLDLKGAIQFVDRYTEGDGFKTIILSGNYAQVMKENIEREAAPLPVVMMDIPPLCGTKDDSPTALFAIGAALFEKFPSKLRMDISGISTALRVTNEIQKVVYGVGAVITAILLLLILNGHRKMASINSDLQAYTQQNSTSDLTGSSAEDIRSKIDAMKQQSNTLSYLFSKNDFLAPKLSVLVDVIPKQLWVENITYVNVLALSASGGSRSGGSGRMLNFSGGTYLTGEARSQVTEGFLRDLKKNENEFKVYLPPKGSMSLSVSAAQKAKPGQASDGISKFSIDATEGGI